MSLSFTGAGAFATSRRGGVDASEIYRLQRKYPRAGAQTLSAMLGVSMATVQALMYRPDPAPVVTAEEAKLDLTLANTGPEPWPFHKAPEVVENVVRMFAASRGLKLRQLVRPGRGPHRMAERAMFATIRELSGMSWEHMAEVFEKDSNSLRRDVKQHYERLLSSAA